MWELNFSILEIYIKICIRFFWSIYYIDLDQRNQKINPCPWIFLTTLPVFKLCLWSFCLVLSKDFHFFIKHVPSFCSFAFFTSLFICKYSSSSFETSNIDARSSFLIIMGVFFLFILLATPRNYKVRNVFVKTQLQIY